MQITQSQFTQFRHYADQLIAIAGNGRDFTEAEFSTFLGLTQLLADIQGQTDHAPELTAAIHNALLDRHRLGILQSEADFLAGAMAVLITFYGSAGLIRDFPTGLWSVFLLSGRSVVEHLQQEKTSEE